MSYLRTRIRLHARRSSWLLGALMPVTLAGCAKDTLFPELDPDRFVSSAPSEGWVPERGVGYEAHPVRPLPLEDGEPGASDPAGPRSLMQLVDLALELNPKTRAVWEAARVKAAQYGSVRSLWYPTFSVGASVFTNQLIYPAGVSNPNNPSGPPTLADVMVADTSGVYPYAQLNYILLDFGRRSSSDARARQALWMANLEFNRQIQTTIFEVQKAYYQLDAANGLYEASLEELELAITVVDAVEDRMAVGLATAPELLLARQGLAQAEFDVQSRISGIDDARSALLVSIGLPATTPIEIDSLREMPLPGDLGFRVEEGINRALADRPDLAAAVAKVREADAMVKYAQADFLPTVTFDGTVGWEDFELETSLNQGPDASQSFSGLEYSVGLTGNWILFEGFELRNNLRQARAARRQAQAELETLRIQAIGEVWDSYSDYIAAQRQYEFGLALAASSREAYDAMIAAYDVGLATITELIDAEKDLAAALATLVTTRATLLTSSASVSYFIGSGPGRSPDPDLAAVRSTAR
ncbi:MAG: TolC family protein [Planctomycetota bacterium]|nr:TolC family protein [Planctomycetota bacterium]